MALYTAQTLLVLEDLYGTRYVDRLLDEGKRWEAFKKTAKKHATAGIVGLALGAGTVGVPVAKQHGDMRQQARQSAEKTAALTKRASRADTDSDVHRRLALKDYDADAVTRQKGWQSAKPARKGWRKGSPGVTQPSKSARRDARVRNDPRRQRAAKEREDYSKRAFPWAYRR